MYVLPVKKAVRVAEDLAVGSGADVHLRDRSPVDTRRQETGAADRGSLFHIRSGVATLSG